MATKQKTHRGAKKRFKLTSKGKLRRRHAFASHLLTKKSSKRKRKLRKEESVHEADAGRVHALLGE